jgi:hypothetical protein
MVSISDALKERNILKLILIVRFACVTLDVGHPIQWNIHSPFPSPLGFRFPSLVNHARHFCAVLSFIWYFWGFRGAVFLVAVLLL